MAIINNINVSFKYSEIDKEFDFYILTTTDKYINGGAYILDKPIESLRAESAVFDNGRSLFLMFKKGSISQLELAEQLEDDKMSLKKNDASGLKDYILFRLFLFSLNNFNSDEIKFNNITGKLYLTNSNWNYKNGKVFKALNINVDQSMNIVCETTSFTSVSLFKNKKAILNYPKYLFSGKNGSLKRALHPENDDVFVRKTLYQGQKTEIPFFSFFSRNELENNKVFYLYKTLRLLKNKYSALMELNFKEMEVQKSITSFRDDDFIETVKEIVAFKNINLVNWSNSPEYDDEFQTITEMFSVGKIAPVIVSNKIDLTAYNVIFLHCKEYYEQNGFKDPYKNIPANCVYQHITIEDSVDKIIKDNESIFETLLKELLIKDDIINNRKISLDDWSSFGFSNEYVFGKEKDGIHFFLTVKQDGQMNFFSKIDDFSKFDKDILNECSNYLTDNKGKEKTVVANDKGDVIVISRTPSFALPSPTIFDAEKISRNKEYRKMYLDGVVDINIYDKGRFYNVGIKGSGMNTRIPKASHLYQIDVIKGANFIEELLNTMAVAFVKYKSFTVMPYPIKYLNEYILMEMNKPNNK